MLFAFAHRIRRWHFGDKMGAGIFQLRIVRARRKDVVTLFGKKESHVFGEGVGLQWCPGLEESWTLVA